MTVWILRLALHATYLPEPITPWPADPLEFSSFVCHQWSHLGLSTHSSCLLATPKYPTLWLLAGPLPETGCFPAWYSVFQSKLPTSCLHSAASVALGSFPSLIPSDLKLYFLSCARGIMEPSTSWMCNRNVIQCLVMSQQVCYQMLLLKFCSTFHFDLSLAIPLFKTLPWPLTRFKFPDLTLKGVHSFIPAYISALIFLFFFSCSFPSPKSPSLQSLEYPSLTLSAPPPSPELGINSLYLEIKQFKSHI